MANKRKKKSIPGTLGVNRRATFDYALEDRYEAGLVLLGWEVKSLRANSGHIAQSHVFIKEGEAWLIGSQILPLSTTAAHSKADPERTRKLLLHRKQLSLLVGAIERKGYTLVPTRLYWSKGHVKLEIALAKGKKLHDKRQSIKEKDWDRSQGRLLREKSYSKDD